MPSDSSDRKLARAQASSVFNSANPPPPPPQSENLPCPRCDSTNTKFCYYNNYNLSQPRHFCKSCRRYWTQGGTLRNVPIGGGTRKNSKRSRVHANTTTTTTSSSTTCSTDIMSDDINSAVKVSQCHEAGNGSFTSLLLSSQPQGHGFLGFEDMGFGFAERSTTTTTTTPATTVWPSYQQVNNATGDFGFCGASTDTSNAAAAVADSSGHAWHMSGGVGVDLQESLVDGDCFSWPDLAISPIANGFK